MNDDRDDRGRFCPWYPLDRAVEHAPDEPGVFQVKRVRGLDLYPLGKSAMRHYDHASALSQAIQAFARTLPDDARHALACRHQVTDDPDEARALHRELMERFRARFGTVPRLAPP